MNSNRTKRAKAQHVGAKKSKRAANGSGESPLTPMYDSELLSFPYRAVAKLMLESQRSALVAMQINRKLAHDMRDILLHEQDVMEGVIERAWERLSDGYQSPATAGALASQSLTELYQAAAEGIQEYGKAIDQAQVRSRSIIRGHSGR